IVASVHLGKTTPGRRCRRSPSAALVSIPSSRFSLLCCKGNLCHFTACRVYLGGNTEDSGRSWWIPDRACLLQMLSKVGFGAVKVAGEYTCRVRRCWLP